MKLVGNNIYLRFLKLEDAQAMLDLHIRNKEFFVKFLTDRDETYYTLEKQTALIEGGIKQREEDQRYSFGIFISGNNELIGNIALSEILRGPLQSCYIGYYLDQQQNGKGIMTEAVRLVTKFGFEILKLHRIEAGVMPHNTKSMRVLEKAGYQKEGVARKNVKINGKWEDHQVLAIIEEDLQG